MIENLKKHKNLTVVKLDPETDINPKKRKPKQSIAKIAATQNKLKYFSKGKIRHAMPIITQNDKPLFFPRTINVIQGKAGSHKSRIAEHIASTLIAKHIENPILGFKNVSDKQITVLYVDTERNISEQFPATIQRIKLNAGYGIEEEPVNFDFISLLEFSITQRFDALKDYLEKVRNEHDNPLVVVIDVVTDCISNFNDVKESQIFIDMLNKTINHHSITFICVIHENPNSADNKARGHIGTEITNKATTVLSVSAVDEDQNVYRVKFVKSRSTERYKPYNVKYNSLTHSLEFTNTIEDKSMQQNKASYLELIEYLKERLNSHPVDRKTLLASISIKFDCSTRTAIERLENIIVADMMSKHGYKLLIENSPDKKQNRKQIRLEKIQAQSDLFCTTN